MGSILDIAKRALPKTVKEALRRSVCRLRDGLFKPYLKKKNVEGVVFDF